MKFRRIDLDLEDDYFEEAKYFIEQRKTKYHFKMSRKDYLKQKFDGKGIEYIFKDLKEQIINGIKWELFQLLRLNEDEQQLLDKIINDGDGLNGNVLSNELNQDVKKIFGKIVPDFIVEFMSGTLEPLQFGLMEQNLLEGPILDFIRKAKFYFLEMRKMDIEYETDEDEDSETEEDEDSETDDDNECDEKMIEVSDESIAIYGLNWKSKKDTEREKIQRHIAKANKVLANEYSLDFTSI